MRGKVYYVRRYVGILVVFFVLSVIGQEQWILRYPSLPVVDLYSVIWAEGQFVAGGACGTILTSPDGKKWTVIEGNLNGAFYTADIKAVQYIDSVYYVKNNRTYEKKSSDLITWDDFSGGTAFAKANGVYVKVEGTFIYRSTDGEEWTMVKDVDQYIGTWGLSDVVWNGFRFVVVGYCIWPTGGKCYGSPDGITWSNISVGGEILKDVASNNKTTIVLSESFAIPTTYDAFLVNAGSDTSRQSVRSVLGGSSLACVSDGYMQAKGNGINITHDGREWTFYTITPDTKTFLSVACGNGILSAVGYGCVIATSTDTGKTWSVENDRSIPMSDGITIGDTNIVVGDSGTLFISEGGVTWDTMNIGTKDNLRKIFYINGCIVILSESGNLYTSSSGVDTWTKQSYDSIGLFRDIVYDSTGLVALCDSTNIMTSTDGITWIRQDSLSEKGRKLTYSNGCLMVSDGYKIFAIRLDGSAWQYLPKRLYHIVWTGQRFFGVSSDSIWEWENGAQWIKHYKDVNGDVEGLLWNDGKLIIIVTEGSGERLRTCIYTSSQDSLKWNRVFYRENSGVVAVYKNGIDLFVQDRNGRVYISPNGTDWKTTTIRVSGSIRDIFRNDKNFFAVCGGGGIYSLPLSSIGIAAPPHKQGVPGRLVFNLRVFGDKITCSVPEVKNGSAVHFTLYNIQGRVLSRVAGKGSETKTISVDMLPSGFYFIRAAVNGAAIARCFSIIR